MVFLLHGGHSHVLYMEIFSHHGALRSTSAVRFFVTPKCHTDKAGRLALSRDGDGDTEREKEKSENPHGDGSGVGRINGGAWEIFVGNYRMSESILGRSKW